MGSLALTNNSLFPNKNIKVFNKYETDIISLWRHNTILHIV